MLKVMLNPDCLFISRVSLRQYFLFSFPVTILSSYLFFSLVFFLNTSKIIFKLWSHLQRFYFTCHFRGISYRVLVTPPLETPGQIPSPLLLKLLVRYPHPTQNHNSPTHHPGCCVAEEEEDGESDHRPHGMRPRRASQLSTATKVKPLPPYSSFFIFSHTNK